MKQYHRSTAICTNKLRVPKSNNLVRSAPKKNITSEISYEMQLKNLSNRIGYEKINMHF